MMYLPEGGNESYLGLSDQISYIRIVFCMRDENGEAIRCADKALLLHKTTDEMTASLCRELPEVFLSDTFRAYGLLYQLLSRISQSNGQKEMNSMKKRLFPAIRYLEQNYIRDVSAPELAAMCHMSETHFRRLFKDYSGVSPMAYRNQLRIRLACRLLQSGQYSITEIADHLGFESVYYFSRVFGKIMGKSPSKWYRGK